MNVKVFENIQENVGRNLGHFGFVVNLMSTTFDETGFNVVATRPNELGGIDHLRFVYNRELGHYFLEDCVLEEFGNYDNMLPLAKTPIFLEALEKTLMSLWRYNEFYSLVCD